MDVNLLLQHFQYSIPVGIVVLCAIIVFAFGFKNAEQPPFAQLSTLNELDRKQSGKKRSGKIKEKRSTNAQVNNEKASPAKKVSPVKSSEPAKKSITTSPEEDDGKLKERKQEDNRPDVPRKDKNQSVKSGKENKVEQTKNKKNLKNLVLEKPLDFDDGDWEQAYSRKDKKNKKKEDETPSKKNKKNKKSDQLINEKVAKEKDNEKVEIKDKTAKETVNKELKEKNQKDVVLEPIVVEDVTVENNVEEKVEVTKIEKIEKVAKEEKKVKSKKSKKVSESDNATLSPAPAAEKKPVEKITPKKAEESKKIAEPVEETTKSVETEAKNAPVFDELGDVWTEAKPQKKSKKKARKDN